MTLEKRLKNRYDGKDEILVPNAIRSSNRAQKEINLQNEKVKVKMKSL